MNLHIWIDENGNWRVSHFPPTDDSSVLTVALGVDDSAPPMFIDHYTGQEIPIEVRP